MRHHRVVVGCTSGADAAERVTAAYLAAVAAVDAGREVVMWLTADGVRLADEGYVDAIQTVWAPPVADLHRRFVAGGGRFYVCPLAWDGCELDAGRLVAGAELRDAAAVLEFARDGALTFSY